MKPRTTRSLILKQISSVFFVLVLSLSFAFQNISFAKKDESPSDPELDLSTYKKSKNAHDIYIGVGFSITGIATRLLDNKIASNGFIVDNPFLGTMVRIGYQYTGNIMYVGIELFGSVFFGVHGGHIGSSGNISVASSGLPGNGIFSAGFNFKPGISFNQRRGSVYIIAGAVYNWFAGKYQDGSIDKQFHMDGFGLNYGIGVKHNLNNFIALFFEFNGLAPIQGGGNFKLDRTAFADGVDFKEVKTMELYTLTLGIDVLM